MSVHYLCDKCGAETDWNHRAFLRTDYQDGEVNPDGGATFRGLNMHLCIPCFRRLTELIEGDRP